MGSPALCVKLSLLKEILAGDRREGGEQDQDHIHPWKVTVAWLCPVMVSVPLRVASLITVALFGFGSLSFPFLHLGLGW
jgi:hypothetical protein